MCHETPTPAMTPSQLSGDRDNCQETPTPVRRTPNLSMGVNKIIIWLIGIYFSFAQEQLNLGCEIFLKPQERFGCACCFGPFIYFRSLFSSNHTNTRHILREFQFQTLHTSQFSTMTQPQVTKFTLLHSSVLTYWHKVQKKESK